MYTEKELAVIAKRENNNKRKYLVVNPLQGKHIPVSPEKALAMFEKLAELVKEAYPNETLLLVGFAETATAIGAALAVKLDTYYMQTTRENVQGVEYLFFSESHSHATEQKLIQTDLDKVIDNIDRIVFVEDEVTTGNTILKIVELIERTYTKKIKFSVASLLNGMNKISQKVYQDRQILTHYLVKTNHDTYTEVADSYRGDGTYYAGNAEEIQETAPIMMVSGYCDGRRLNCGKEYGEACKKLWEEIAQAVSFQENRKILVLGTEEFMYPALYVAKRLEELGYEVRNHATTRSPIAVSSEAAYPLHMRYELVSLYDEERKTFLYDIGTYDLVLVITDAPITDRGRKTLIHALTACGNKNIKLIRWC